MNLDECKKEMRSIVGELQDIEWGVRRDFSNIGQDLCADCINKISDKYEYVSRELNKVSYNLIASLINNNDTE